MVRIVCIIALCVPTAKSTATACYNWHQCNWRKIPENYRVNCMESIF
jgi:hypothetical protein